MWCIPAPANAVFVCQMETVLAVYRRASDPAYPVVRSMDETSVQCAREACDPIPAKPGQSECYDVEYERNGVTHLLAFYAPFENWRRIDIADNHAAEQWAQRVRRLVQEDYPQATRITLVMDNLNTHGSASLYKVFLPHVARSLLDKLECVYTPKHGGWLNLAECEFSVLGRQCLPVTTGSRDGRFRSPGMDGDPEPIQSTRRLALCHGRRMDQAQTSLSYIIRLMCH